jgi:hypothetical protein
MDSCPAQFVLFAAIENRNARNRVRVSAKDVNLIGNSHEQLA